MPELLGTRVLVGRMISPARLQELRALAQRATPGPWDSVRRPGNGATVREAGQRLMRGGRKPVAVALCGRVVSEPRRALNNAAFIAALSPDVVLELIAAAEKQLRDHDEAGEA